MDMFLRETISAFGTQNTLTVFDAADRAPAMKEAKEALLSLHRKLSVFSPDSELSRLNAAAGRHPVKLSEDTLLMLQKAKLYSKMTDGAFSASVFPLTSLWKIGIHAGEVPGEHAIRHACSLIRDEDLILDEQASTAMLCRPGQGINPGGIAKGFAADRVRRIFSEYGVKDVIINLGGTVTVMGKERRVGIQHPERQTGFSMGTIPVQDLSVVTSGDYERFFESGGKKYHHILDPKTGYPADSELCSITLIGKDATLLDAFSTAFFVLGLQRGLRLLKEFSLEGILITKELRVFCTNGLSKKFRLLEPVCTERCAV